MTFLSSIWTELAFKMTCSITFPGIKMRLMACRSWVLFLAYFENWGDISFLAVLSISPIFMTFQRNIIEMMIVMMRMIDDYNDDDGDDNDDDVTGDRMWEKNGLRISPFI
ncbi:hypothetical protein TURU_020472 [Turdus rufiventris]|nr:hypothetical protein TURU_020472 [Turdus rufiventris]